MDLNIFGNGEAESPNAKKVKLVKEEINDRARYFIRKQN